jgi:TolB-like protein/class 3 adenylate cyclase/Tfp pilus assembly protein PilF
MSTETSKQIALEIAHVLFIDIVGYSKLSINEQRAAVDELNEIVRASDQFQKAEAAARLIKIPTGDGMALVFYTSPEAPAQSAVEISRALKENPRLQLRMGVHSGPVSGVIDVNGHANLAGAGLNIARRVMDCGDAGHILLSKHVAEDLEEYEQWRPLLHELGTCEVKHGARVGIVNLYADHVGNPQLPKRFQALKKHRARVRWSATAAAVLTLATIVVGVAMFSRGRARLMLAAPPEKSIAVLPFENLSEDKANAYFADGIQDEILTRLAKIADLKVISRTSTQHYKSAPENLPEIARQLGVAHILEGRVQKSGDTVRVNVQLIKAANDSHLWADTFDRKLTDIFSVESEVAGAIAEQLNATLTGAEQKALAVKPTNNVAAYDAYLRGRSVEISGYSFPTSEQAAAAYYAEAVRLDPKFVLAWARLAVKRSTLYFNFVDRRTNSAAAVKEAMDQVLSLQPESGEAWIAQGAYRYRVLRDFSGALRAYEEASKRLPNNPDVFQEMAYVEERLGHWESAEKHLKAAAGLDPRNLGILLIMANEFLDGLRRFADAHAVVDRALQIAPGEESALAIKAGLFLEEGKLDAAARVLAQIPVDSQNETVLYIRTRQLIYERRFEDAIKFLTGALKSREGREPRGLNDLGYCQEWIGRTDEARTTFARAAGQAINQSTARREIARAYAGLGDKEKALEEARLAVTERENDAKTKPYAETVLAQIQARFGDLDSAFAALPHLLEVPFGITRGDLRFDPMWDPLRKDPRFEKLASTTPKTAEK